MEANCFRVRTTLEMDLPKRYNEDGGAAGRSQEYWRGKMKRLVAPPIVLIKDTRSGSRAQRRGIWVRVLTGWMDARSGCCLNMPRLSTPSIRLT